MSPIKLALCLSLVGCGSAIGPNQQAINSAKTSVSFDPDRTLEQNVTCTKFNTYKNVLTFVGGGLTLGSGAVAMGTIVASTRNNAPAEEALGISTGALAGLGGALAVLGAVLTQAFQNHHCATAPTP